MRTFPVDLQEYDSPQKKVSICEEIIEELERISLVGNQTIRIVPIFEMSANTGLKKLIPYDGKNLFVNEDVYITFELDRRIVYISRDTKDVRPFIYWGGIEPYNNFNSKRYLEDLIFNDIKIKNQNVKIKYIDNDLSNLKRSNIKLESIETTSPPFLEIKKYIQDESIKVTSKSEIKPEAKLKPTPEVTAEEKEFIFNTLLNNQKIEDSKKLIEHYDNQEAPEIDVKVKKTLENIEASRALTPLEKQFLKNRVIKESDINDLSHNWLGVSKYSTKEGFKYSAIIKGIIIKSAINSALDAAKEYNEFIIKNGLPYPINNIPGVLYSQILKQWEYNMLKDYKTWQLAEEILKRTKPSDPLDNGY